MMSSLNVEETVRRLASHLQQSGGQSHSSTGSTPACQQCFVMADLQNWALMTACISGHAQVADHLLQRGADVAAANTHVWH